MTALPRLGAATLCLVAVVGLAGCQNTTKQSARASGSASPGTLASSGQPTPAGSAPATPKFPAFDVAKIKQSWGHFFDSKTGLSQRIRLLQNGQKFDSYLLLHQKSFQQADIASTVSKVQIANDRKATVTFSITRHGKPVVSDATGMAYYHAARWQVSTATYCTVVTRYGQPKPAICP